MATFGASGRSDIPHFFDHAGLFFAQKLMPVLCYGGGLNRYIYETMLLIC